MIMEAEKSQGLQSVSWTPRKTDGVFPVWVQKQEKNSTPDQGSQAGKFSLTWGSISDQKLLISWNSLEVSGIPRRELSMPQ